ncbi:MAG: hypothetical protein QOF19_2860 [Alphaproteobacteria bacterium]|nr:hypothetical protein [Alphaproteobacteria bacterium]MEA2991280.1 hypothetical protein [Alphaproteobacteria bacterium]
MDEDIATSSDKAGGEAGSAKGADVVVQAEAGAAPEIALATDKPAQEPAARPAEPAAEIQANTTNIECSRGLADWLIINNVSLAFTSYQTGQLFLIGVLPDRRISVHQRNFIRAMGLLSQPDRVYVASIESIWRLENILKRTEVANQSFDRLFVPRNAQITGDLDVHEINVDKHGRLIFVNTSYSCLATFSVTHSFKPIWKPKFISKLAPEDRCHLNGFAMVDGKPKYVTSVSQSDLVNGWRENRHVGGVLIEIETDRIVTDELSMPHSPRVVDGNLWVLDSGRGYIARVDETTGKREDVAFCPGFLRGLSIWNGHGIATVSLPRDGTFKDLELEKNIKARGGVPWCGIQIVDLRTGDIVQWIRLQGFIKELFDVGVIPGARCPMALGVGTPEVQHTISYETELAPISLDPVVPKEAETAQST